jgi:TolB-like protein/AraC-like DNA-binding protein/Tfp pilus assembly protein PilF
MANPTTIENDFLTQLTVIVDKNIANEQFGVSELADEMNMSRSNLLRKVKKVTKLSVSQLISQVRLKRAMELLRKSSFNVSEVSQQVGFSSTSYFIKCFREYYGYPPGEVGKRPDEQVAPVPAYRPKKKRNLVIMASVGIMVALAVGLLMYSIRTGSGSDSAAVEKSVVVLPFKNESNDSTNVYLINGLMESTLNNLQKIKDLKVISRTSAEKYRNTTKSIPEMAKELNANYFIEGSGQKIGDKILLNIQLIEGSTDKHLWANQYRREAKDIFALQQEIAKNIAEEIQAIITPEEVQRIERNPTDNVEAYDLFLKGREEFYKGERKNLEAAIPIFKKAIEHDGEFALAHAEIALIYYYLDIFQAEKKYTAEMNSYADKALLFDPKLANSLVAKALYYMHNKEYELAVPYLEKALEYTPNSILAINYLALIYNNNIPNTTKYLEYALKAVRLEANAQDSATTSNNYLRLSDALIQTGFVDEALKYCNKSLDYNPKNFFSRWVKVFILYAKDKDLNKTKQLLLQELKRDTTQLLMVEEIAKVHYLMGDFEGAYPYYKRFLELKDAYRLDIFKNENLKIGIVLDKVGQKEKAQEFVKSFKSYADNDKSIYKHLNLAGYYAYLGDDNKSIEHMKLFSKEENLKYWVLLFDSDPIVKAVKDHPEFDKVMGDIEKKFWNTHEEIKVTLKEKGLL